MPSVGRVQVSPSWALGGGGGGVAETVGAGVWVEVGGRVAVSVMSGVTEGGTGWVAAGLFWATSVVGVTDGLFPFKLL